MAKKSETDLVLKCRKCGHNLFVGSIDGFISLKTLVRLSEKGECPECGEEGFENFLISRAGNFDKEYGNK